MKQTLPEFIVALSSLAGVTGDEGRETDKLLALVTGYDETWEDAVGNRVFL